jgi:predicted CXXCH cytochrome family protein
MKRLALVPLLLALPAACSRPGGGGGEPATLVGQATCAECHADQATAWQGSHHALAMQPADSNTVQADFGGTTFRYTTGVTTTASRRDGGYWVRTDGPDGTLTDYPIAYAFGISPLQEYLIAFPGGRYQALNVVWDARPKADGGQRWFHLYPNERVDHRDVLHWTGPLQNWNFMCAECHSTGVRKNYRADSATYSTTWSEVSVSCEACHGPGSRHVARARQGEGAAEGLEVPLQPTPAGTWQFGPGDSIARRSQPLASRAEVETCGRCHARRSVDWEEYRHGDLLAQTHRVALLDEGAYHADGQILDEVYEYGSFRQSRMYAAGVTCSDCHEPHSGRLRAEGNALCATCHLPARYDGPAHAFHPSGGAAARCVSCHMVERRYMVVDGRRDHSFRVPRPDLSVRIGTPNACTDCHTGRSPQWADEWVGRWYGAGRRSGWHYADAIAAGRRQAPGAEAELIGAAFDSTVPAIARATAVTLLPRNAGERTLEAIERAARDPDELVRRAAAEALVSVDMAVRLRVGLPLLRDSVRGVRLPATSALAGVPAGQWSPDQRATFDSAAAEYRASQHVNADRPESWLNLGQFEAQVRRPAEAEAAYRTAIRLGRGAPVTHVGLAQLYADLGREAEAERVLREGLAASSDSPDLRHALGLSLVRQRRLPEAIPELAAAARMDSTSGRYAYVYAVALYEGGESGRAIEVLIAAQARYPADRDILQALTSYNLQLGDLDGARRWAQRLVAAAPSDPDARRQLEQIMRLRVAPRRE